MAETPEENLPFLEDLAASRQEERINPTYRKFLDDLIHASKYDRDFAEKAATSVLGVLDEQLNATLVSNPEERLPYTLQELIRWSRRPGEQPFEAFDPETLIYSVGADLDLDAPQAEGVVRTVLTAVRKQLTKGQAEFVGRKLPAKIQNLWFGHEHADPRFESDLKPRDR